MNYKFVKISSYYDSYLEYFYKNNNNIPSNYTDHLNKIFQDCFSYGNTFSKHLHKKGNKTHEIIYNDERLQKKWADENNFSYNKFSWKKDILIEQLRKINPEIIFWNMYVSKELLKNIKENLPNIKINFTQVGVKINNYNRLEEFDFVLSCLKSQVYELGNKGVNSYYLRHGFNKSVLNKINTSEINKYNLSFVGSIFSGEGYHYNRAEYIKYLMKNINDFIIKTTFDNPSMTEYLEVFLRQVIGKSLVFIKRIGVNDELFPYIFKYKNIDRLLNKKKLIRFPKSLQDKFESPVFGIDMFQLLSDSKISFNKHIDFTNDEEAANMRMFETTGVGTCLITDWKKNIEDFFQPDYEIVTYKNKEDALEKIKYLLNNPKECQKIAKKGQIKTLKEHTLEHRIHEVNEIILNHLDN